MDSRVSIRRVSFFAEPVTIKLSGISISSSSVQYGIILLLTVKDLAVLGTDNIMKVNFLRVNDSVECICHI